MSELIIKYLGLITLVATVSYFFQKPYKDTVEGRTRSLFVAVTGLVWGVLWIFVIDVLVYLSVLFYAFNNKIGRPEFMWITAIIVVLIWLKNLGLIKVKVSFWSEAVCYIPNLYLVYVYFIK